MTLRQWRREDVVFLGPQGRLDARTAPEFKRQARDLARCHRKLAVDLSDVVFMDSSGLGCLISAMQAMREHGGELKLCGLTPRAQQVMQTVKLDRVFDISPDQDEVLRRFGSQGPDS